MKINQAWFSGINIENNKALKDTYIDAYNGYLDSLSPLQLYKECISGLNRIQRGKAWAHESFAGDITVGDICYIDYGLAYINEAGYQHFGLVLAIFHHKFLVVPMTSNATTIQNARNVDFEGKKHLYFLGKIRGLNKPSVLFLNDFKFINSSRIISVNGKISPKSEMFKEILDVVKNEIFEN